MGHVHAGARGLRRAVRRIDAGRARHRAATRRHRTRRVPSWRHPFLPTLRVAVVALLRCRSLHQSHLAVVDARGTNAVGHVAGRDEVLRSREAAGHQPAGELPGRRRAHCRDELRDGLPEGSRAARRAPRSRRRAVHVRGALRRRRLAHRPLRSLLQRVRPIHLGRGADCRTQGPARRAEADAENADEAVVGSRRG